MPNDVDASFWEARLSASLGQVRRESGVDPRASRSEASTLLTPGGAAEIGKGPIVRVGDKVSSFDRPATPRLLSVAQEEKIAVQRCLLDGGTCEATAYQLYGYTCAAASLALGNYHNVTPAGTIAAEYVALDDFVGMVRLCLATVLRGGKAGDPRKGVAEKAGRKRPKLSRVLSSLTM